MKGARARIPQSPTSPPWSLITPCNHLSSAHLRSPRPKHAPSCRQRKHRAPRCSQCPWFGFPGQILKANTILRSSFDVRFCMNPLDPGRDFGSVIGIFVHHTPLHYHSSTCVMYHIRAGPCTIHGGERHAPASEGLLPIPDRKRRHMFLLPPRHTSVRSNGVRAKHKYDKILVLYPIKPRLMQSWFYALGNQCKAPSYLSAYAVWRVACSLWCVVRGVWCGVLCVVERRVKCPHTSAPV